MIRALLLVLLLFQQGSRPTEPGDPMPPPNMDYFLGTWSFDWNVPESPLGPGGKMKGTETYKKKLNSYESEIVGEGPAGPLKGRALTSYDEGKKIVSRIESGLFGISVEKKGPIGGDLGGYYTIYWEGAPIKKSGKAVKLKGKTLMLSPAHYKVQMEISVDGGPFTSLGNAWFRKEGATPAQ